MIATELKKKKNLKFSDRLGMRYCVLWVSGFWWGGDPRAQKGALWSQDGDEGAQKGDLGAQKGAPGWQVWFPVMV